MCDCIAHTSAACGAHRAGHRRTPLNAHCACAAEYSPASSMKSLSSAVSSYASSGSSGPEGRMRLSPAALGSAAAGCRCRFGLLPRCCSCCLSRLSFLLFFFLPPSSPPAVCGRHNRPATGCHANELLLVCLHGRAVLQPSSCLHRLPHTAVLSLPCSKRGSTALLL